MYLYVLVCTGTYRYINCNRQVSGALWWPHCACGAASIYPGAQACRPYQQQRKVAKASSKWSACVLWMSISVRTSMYQYVPVCTCDIWTLIFLKLNLILAYLLHWSFLLLQSTLEELPGCMRNIHVLLIVYTCTYWYVLFKESCTVMYRYVLVRTSTYRYIRFCPILYRCIGFQMLVAVVQPGVGVVPTWKPGL